MKKFAKKLAIMAFLVLLSLSVVDYVVTSGLKKSECYLFSEWNDIIRGKVNADWIINGSSRAWVTISPQILEENLNQSFYNLGLDGYPFFMEKARYDLFLKYNEKPKGIIQTLDLFLLAKRNGLYNEGQFLPYIDEPILKNSVSEYDGLSFIDSKIPAMRYIHRPEIMEIGFAEFTGMRHVTNNKYKGYEGQEKSWDHAFDSFYEMHKKEGIFQEIDEDILKLFDEYLCKCKEDGIELILVYPPEYIEAQKLYRNREDVMDIYRELSLKYDFKFIDYSDNYLSHDKAYFYNSQHLNKKGSELFTEDLSKKLLK